MKFPGIGIDISHHNVDNRGKPIDWNAVLAAGYKFAFIKATDGATHKDSKFVQNVQGAKAAGLAVGAYHFLRPGTQASDQAQNFLDQIELVGGADVLDLGAAVDVEDPDDDPGSWNQLDIGTRADKVRHWISAVGDSFESPLIYCIPHWFGENIGQDDDFASYPLWAASPGKAPNLTGSPWSEYALWQYNFHGTVNGIGLKNVDLDRPNPSLVAP